jgi:hypothetical protein
MEQLRATRRRIEEAVHGGRLETSLEEAQEQLQRLRDAEDALKAESGKLKAEMKKKKKNDPRVHD